MECIVAHVVMSQYHCWNYCKKCRPKIKRNGRVITKQDIQTLYVHLVTILKYEMLVYDTGTIA